MNKTEIRLLGIAAASLASQCQIASEDGAQASDMTPAIRTSFLGVKKAGSGLTRVRSIVKKAPK